MTRTSPGILARQIVSSFPEAPPSSIENLEPTFKSSLAMKGDKKCQNRLSSQRAFDSALKQSELLTEFPFPIFYCFKNIPVAHRNPCLTGQKCLTNFTQSCVRLFVFHTFENSDAQYPVSLFTTQYLVSVFF